MLLQRVQSVHAWKDELPGAKKKLFFGSLDKSRLNRLPFSLDCQLDHSCLLGLWLGSAWCLLEAASTVYTDWPQIHIADSHPPIPLDFYLRGLRLFCGVEFFPGPVEIAVLPGRVVWEIFGIILAKRFTICLHDSWDVSNASTRKHSYFYWFRKKIHTTK